MRPLYGWLPLTLLLVLLLGGAAWWLTGRGSDLPVGPAVVPADPPAPPGTSPAAPELERTPVPGPTTPSPLVGPATPGTAPSLPGAPVATVQEQVEALRQSLEEGGVGPRAQDAQAQVLRIFKARDGELLLETLRMIPRLKAAALEAEPLRAALLTLIDQGQGQVPVVAAFALRRVGARTEDIAALVATARKTTDGAAAVRVAFQALILSEDGAQGEVGDLFVNLLGRDQAATACAAANALRGLQSSEPVQAAVVAAWERHGPLEEHGGSWFHTLGQIVPVRPVLVPALFDILDRFETFERSKDYVLLTQSLKRNVEASAKDEVARRAGLLAERTADDGIRQEALRILLVQGNVAQAEIARRLAADERLSAATRTLASAVERALTGR